MPAIERFLASGGWNVATVYSALAQSGSKPYALDMYGRLRDIYGPDLQAYLDQLLGVRTGTAERAA
ncbi:MAG TPA: hypothetical protein VEK57_04010 [Thermoanaerobaculia bacterium]|nr:hypothetical protein [Thermoanaerobaculia bacterium]